MIWRIFIPIAKKLKNFYPETKRYLLQINSKYTIEEFISRNLGYATFIFLITLLLAIKNFKVGIATSLTLGFLTFFYLMDMPKLKVLRKRRSIESKLIFAVDKMRIKLSSGASLFDTLKSIANSDYGELSKEVAIIVKEIEGGTPEVEALEKAARRNPSPIFRKILWEISSSIRSGGNVVDTLKSALVDLTRQLEIKMKTYTGELNVYLLVYMVLSIVFPVLMIIALTVVSILSNISISNLLIYSIPVLVIIFQFGIIGLIKSKRPYLWSEE